MTTHMPVSNPRILDLRIATDKGAQSRLTGFSVNWKSINRFFGSEKIRTMNQTEITG